MESDPTEGDVWGVVSNPNAGKAPYAVRVMKQNEHVRTIRLEPDITYIGRMPENHVVLDDVKVSRSHARILKRGTQYVIEDQESENGIFVNGKKVGEFPLKPGLLIGVGGHVLEVVRAQADDREAAREKQIDRAEDEEWRMDQTVSGTPAQIAKLMAVRDTSQDTAAKSAAKAPQMNFVVELGNRKIEKTFEITQARARKEDDPQQDQAEIRIFVGKWVLYKKIPL